MTKKLFCYILGSVVLCLAFAFPTVRASSNEIPLNVLTDNPVLGDETDFLRIIPWKSDEPMNIEEFITGEIDLQADQVYALYVYYHNSGQETLQDVVLNLSLPEILNPGETGMISAMLITGGKNPGIVDSEIEINSDQTLSLRVGSVDPDAPGQAIVYDESLSTNVFLPMPVVTINGVVSTEISLGDIEPGYLSSKYLIFGLATKTEQIAEASEPSRPVDRLNLNEIWIATAAAIIIVFIACSIGQYRKSKERRS